MISGLVFIAITLVVILASYIVVHHFYPTWGTVTVNIAAALAPVLDYAQQFVTQAKDLPWNTIMSAEHAAQVFMSLAIANVMIRFNGPKLPVGQPNAGQ